MNRLYKFIVRCLAILFVNQLLLLALGLTYRTALVMLMTSCFWALILSALVFTIAIVVVLWLRGEL